MEKIGPMICTILLITKVSMSDLDGEVSRKIITPTYIAIRYLEWAIQAHYLIILK